MLLPAMPFGRSPGVRGRTAQHMGTLSARRSNPECAPQPPSKSSAAISWSSQIPRLQAGPGKTQAVSPRRFRRIGGLQIAASLQTSPGLVVGGGKGPGGGLPRF